MQYDEQGEKSKATKHFNKCVDVTSAMALELIKICRGRNIDCIVAPFEADAQLAYLALHGMKYIILFILNFKNAEQLNFVNFSYHYRNRRFDYYRRL